MATTTLTNRCREYSWKKALDFENDTFKLALYNPNSGHDANTNAYTATGEATGSNYTAGGQAMTGNTLTVDTTNNVVYMDFADVEWTNSTITATDCMIYDDTVTTPAADPSIYIGDFNGSKSTNSGTFTVQMPAAAHNTAIVRFA